LTEPSPANGLKLFLLAPQMGQHQSLGSSVNLVPLGMFNLRGGLSGS